VPPVRQLSLPVGRTRRRSCGRCVLRRTASGWELLAVRDELHGSHAVLVASKLIAVVLSALTAWLPARATTPVARGDFGAATAAIALLPVLLGVQLTL